MLPHWPDMANHSKGIKALNDFAVAFNSVNNIVVFSRSLERVEGKNTCIVHPADEMRRLKQEDVKV